MVLARHIALLARNGVMSPSIRMAGDVERSCLVSWTGLTWLSALLEVRGRFGQLFSMITAPT